MTREGRDFQVFDAKTGEDITRNVLTQIVMDGENGKQTMLPVPFLRQLIAMYGDFDAGDGAALSRGVDGGVRQEPGAVPRIGRRRSSAGAAFKPFETLAKQNMAMFQAAADMLTGRAALGAKAADARPATGELETLKAQMAALQAQLDKLGK